MVADYLIDWCLQPSITRQWLRVQMLQCLTLLCPVTCLFIEQNSYTVLKTCYLRSLPWKFLVKYKPGILEKGAWKAINMHCVHSRHLSFGWRMLCGLNKCASFTACVVLHVHAKFMCQEKHVLCQVY